MALIICPECGKQISDQAENCPSCGYPIREARQQAQEITTVLSTVEKKHIEEKPSISTEGKVISCDPVFSSLKRQTKAHISNRNINIIAGCVLALFIAAIFFNIYIFKPNKEYKQAKAYLNSSDFDSAILSFEKLGNYKDSDILLKESKYQLALKYADDQSSVGNYEMAIQTFSEIPNYKDSALKLDKVKFDLASRYIVEQRYDDAIALYKQLGDYQDSADRKNEAMYLKAVALLDKGELDNSEVVLQTLKNYKDSKKLLAEIEFLRPFQGTWYDGTNNDGYALLGTTFNSNKYQFNQGSLVFDNPLCACALSIKDNKLIEKVAFDKNSDFTSMNHVNTYTKDNNYKYVQPPESPTPMPEEPRIGMTAEEVENSSWGEPKDINTTITAHGTQEQWVYAIDKYIYFENGVVTTIQK